MNTNDFVRYENFGAVGDGITDDFDAMLRAHAYANEKRLPVKAEPGKSYYIGKSGVRTIEIMTDTDWTDATIIIDDTSIMPSDPERTVRPIYIKSDYEGKRYEKGDEVIDKILECGGIKTTTRKIPYAPGYPAMIIPYDTERKVYIRFGGNADNGSYQHEVIVIDENGNIDNDTPALLDYNNISYILEYRIDDTPITIKGGTVITRANQAPNAYTYYERGLEIARSNVTIDGLKHKRTGEGSHGAPYYGFISTKFINNLLVVNCEFQAHRYNRNEDPSTGGLTNMGTYEIGGTNSNKVYYKNCTQSNFFHPVTGKPTNTYFDEEGNAVGALWGVMGTNYCKNITYDGCVLNRLDAHAGVYNATIKGGSHCTMINLIGGGTALIEDSTMYGDKIINLRQDYGSVWNGEIVVKNSTLISSGVKSLFTAYWNNHDFGYTTYLPNITIDGLKIEPAIACVSIFSDMPEGRCDGDFTGKTVTIDGKETENKNPTVMPERITVKNCDGVQFTAAPEGSWLEERLGKLI